MAEPPGAVARAFTPVEPLQLHRLQGRAAFRCVRCEQDRIDNFIAIRDGDWAQTICSTCYSVHARHKKKSKVPQEAKPDGVQAKQASRRAGSARRRGSPAEINAAKEQRLLRQMPRASQVFNFFRAAGVEIEVGLRGGLLINGHQTSSLRSMLHEPRGRGWDGMIDELAMRYARDALISAVERNAQFGDGLRALRPKYSWGIVIARHEVRLATIYATHASVPHFRTIYANFLTPGSHWAELADRISRAEQWLITEWRGKQDAKALVEAQMAAADAPVRHFSRWRRIDRLPADIPPVLAEACIEASRQIRLDRQVAYDRAVTLECEAGELTLLPIAGSQARLVVPFHLSAGARQISAELLLSDIDPVPVLVGDDVTEEDAIAAWIYALLGFAAATCFEVDATPRVESNASATARWDASSFDRGRGSSAQIRDSKRPWPRHLEPTGRWIQYSGSFVAGHRRRLVDGQTASDLALSRAKLVGIVLHPNETWVRPHARGLPDGMEMRFRWHPPKTFSDLAPLRNLAGLGIECVCPYARPDRQPAGFPNLKDPRSEFAK